jgi:hypothetical protein
LSADNTTSSRSTATRPHTNGRLGAITFRWGDGTTSYGGSTTGDGRGWATHTYGSPGTYTIVGTVTDSKGRTRTYRQQVTVSGH